MRPVLRRLACLLPSIVVGAIVAAGAGSTAAVGRANPLHEEDIVRLYVAGTPTDEIIERIRTSAVSFDLSDEMIGELRLAGLPSEVIHAMVERQRELEPPPDEAPEPDRVAGDAGLALLRVEVRANRESRHERGVPVVRLRAEIDPDTRRELRLRAPKPSFTDLALVLLCTTPDHVPDQWRSRSPLGRDFIGSPKHAMLAFHSGAERHEAGSPRASVSRSGTTPGARGSMSKPAVLELVIPDTLEARVEPGVHHDLVLGVAAEVEGRYYLLAHGDVSVSVPAGGRQLEAEIRSARDGSPGALRVLWRVTQRDADNGP